MSISVMNWAWNLTLPPTEKLILMSLADHADDSGICYPSQQRIADKCCVSRRTVIRILLAFENRGIVSTEARPGDGEGRKTNIYTINLAWQSDKLSQGKVTECHRGNVTSVQGNVTPVSHKPSVEPPVIDIYTDDFAQIWQTYPKREGSNPKGRAFSAYKRQRKNHSHELLLTRVKQYADFCEAKGRTGTEFVKQASTFFGKDFDPEYEWTVTHENSSRNNKERNQSAADDYDRQFQEAVARNMGTGDFQQNETEVRETMDDTPYGVRQGHVTGYQGMAASVIKLYG